MNLHDALIASALLQAASANHITLALNTDLNTVTTPGMYRSDNKTTTASMLNVPTAVGGHGFALEVFYSAEYPSVVQRLTWGSYNVHVPHCTIRCGRPIDGVMTWGVWHELNTTAQATTQTTALDAGDDTMASTTEVTPETFTE